MRDGPHRFQSEQSLRVALTRNHGMTRTRAIRSDRIRTIRLIIGRPKRTALKMAQFETGRDDAQVEQTDGPCLPDLLANRIPAMKRPDQRVSNARHIHNRNMNYYAHTAETETGERDPNQSRWQLLSMHLQGVAAKAREFGAPFGLADAAEQAGLLHDLGKYRDSFQKYLAGERPGSVETHHAVYGAALAFERNWCGPAFAIAGHHAGLHDVSDLQDLVRGEKYDAKNRFVPLAQQFKAELGEIPDELTEPEFAECAGDPAVIEFYVRMLFSCLVDADSLDTEQFKIRRERHSVELDASLLLERLQAHRDKFDSSGELNQLRNKVFEDCLAKAAKPPGFFSLTVPTGGGKTLSGMAFALEYARHHGMRRVIVVIPYLSIIEQNAAEYRKVLDPHNEGIVIEHHSAVVEKDDNAERARPPEELAAENWDAPVIVTTSVQFIESLFANRASKCRKLHNIANSVVLLDEVQTLPSHLLNPLLHVLRDLKKHYRTSFVFSTATQPAFGRSASLSNGFDADEMKEIASRPGELFQKLSRVAYEVRITESDWSGLAAEWTNEPQALGVVNTRKQAAEWWEVLRDSLRIQELREEELAAKLRPAPTFSTTRKVRVVVLLVAGAFRATCAVRSGTRPGWASGFVALAVCSPAHCAAGRCCSGAAIARSALLPPSVCRRSRH